MGSCSCIAFGVGGVFDGALRRAKISSEQTAAEGSSQAAWLMAIMVVRANGKRAF